MRLLHYSNEYLEFDLPDGYAVTGSSMLTVFIKGPESTPTASLDLLLPPNAEYLYERLITINPLDNPLANPAYKIGELQTMATASGPIHYREWDFHCIIDWDTVDVPELRGQVSRSHERYVEAILLHNPLGVRLRIKQGASCNAAKGDDIEKIIEESMGEFSFLFSILTSVRFKIMELDRIRNIVRDRYTNFYTNCRERTEYFLECYFDKRNPPPIPHFFTPHETPVLEAIMYALGCRLGSIYKWFYRLNQQGVYEYSPPEWDDFACWNDPINILSFQKLRVGNARIIYLDADISPEKISELENNLDTFVRQQYPHLSPKDLVDTVIYPSPMDTVDFYSKHIDEIGFVGLDPENEWGDWLLCLFSPKKLELAKRVRQAVEESGYPVWTVDDMNRFIG